MPFLDGGDTTFEVSCCLHFTGLLANWVLSTPWDVRCHQHLEGKEKLRTTIQDPLLTTVGENHGDGYS